MSKEQIEEIKAVLVRTCKRVRTMQEDHMQDRYAEAIYTAGYRKQSENMVEVVRCKDCKHCTLTEDGEYNPEDIVCGYFMTDGMQAYDYCSYGERKE